MTAARNAYRYLTVVLAADIVVQFFLAGAGTFRAGPGKAARDSSAFDPHRANGSLIQVLALLLLLSAIAAHNGRWKPALAVFLLSIIQILLATSGWVGGLHPIGGLVLMGLVGWMAHDAWRGQAHTTVASSP
jgi:hypothetical protein